MKKNFFKVKSIALIYFSILLIHPLESSGSDVVKFQKFELGKTTINDVAQIISLNPKLLFEKPNSFTIKTKVIIDKAIFPANFYFYNNKLVEINIILRHSPYDKENPDPLESLDPLEASQERYLRAINRDINVLEPIGEADSVFQAKMAEIIRNYLDKEFGKSKEHGWYRYPKSKIDYIYVCDAWGHKRNDIAIACESASIVIGRGHLLSTATNLLNLDYMSTPTSSLAYETLVFRDTENQQNFYNYHSNQKFLKNKEKENSEIEKLKQSM